MDQVGLMIGGGPASFTVVERGNCVLIEGMMPAKWLTVISSAVPDGAIVSPDLARMLGANFAFGLQEDVEALIASITPEVEAAARQNKKHTGLSDAAVLWLASGERGISSNTIFTVLTGIDALDGWRKDIPSDPADVRRCRLLLDRCPELAARFHEMSSVDGWYGLVRDWDLICKTMDEEIGGFRHPKKGASAPRTYELIKLATGRK